MTMHEVVHEMVMGECHEPNSEGSSSAWKAYMNARVAGLFLLVLLESQREQLERFCFGPPQSDLALNTICHGVIVSTPRERPQLPTSVVSYRVSTRDTYYTLTVGVLQQE
nr:hypothetical protein [Tanacetum cinerariifolium]